MGNPAGSGSPDIDAFIARWTAREGGAERANYQMFLTELCALIGVEKPDVSGIDTERNDYVFERAVHFRHDDGSASTGRIDLYKRDLGEKVQKPTFPTSAVEQTAAVFAALVSAAAPLDASVIAAGFRQGKRVEKKIASVLQSLARLGHVATADGGRTFTIRRAA